MIDSGPDGVGHGVCPHGDSCSSAYFTARQPGEIGPLGCNKSPHFPDPDEKEPMCRKRRRAPTSARQIAFLDYLPRRGAVGAASAPRHNCGPATPEAKPSRPQHFTKNDTRVSFFDEVSAPFPIRVQKRKNGTRLYRPCRTGLANIREGMRS